ncbi:hypothetical protein RUND412_002430 [Rhizina undulata]
MQIEKKLMPTKATQKLRKAACPTRPHTSPPKDDVAPPQPTPKKVHLREVRQLLQHSGYRLLADRRAQKKKQRLATSVVEVPAVVAEEEVKMDGVGEDKKEERKEKEGLVMLMERLMVGEDMEMKDAQ